MLAHLADSNVEIIAAKAGISRRHLTELFKHYRDATPGAGYVSSACNTHKVTATTANDEIKDIAEACGFHSVSHFAQLFSKSFGCCHIRGTAAFFHLNMQGHPRVNRLRTHRTISAYYGA